MKIILVYLAIIIMYFVGVFNGYDSGRKEAIHSDEICQKHFNTDSITVSIEKARTVYHKQDKPNTIIIKCEGK
jgi:hypothetical protein